MSRIMEILRQIKEMVDRLKDIEGKRKLCEEILEKIREFEEMLEDGHIDELEAFRLLINLIELIGSLGGDKVPLLDTFIELYLAALNSTLYVIEHVLQTHSNLHLRCEEYCRIRAEREALSRENGETDEDALALDGHRSAMISIGWYQYERYEGQFRAQYEDYKKKLQLEEFQARARAALDAPPAPAAPAGGGGTSAGNDEEREREWRRLKARLDAWLEFGERLGRQILDLRERLRNPDLSPEERRRLEADLRHLEEILGRVFGP
jgi:hypothetical protein